MTHTYGRRALRVKMAAALVGLSLTLAACGEFDAPNQNSGTLNELTSSAPTKVTVNTAAQGLFSGVRGAAGALGLGQLGREAYSLDVSNPQAVPPVFTAPNQLQSFWGGAYTFLEQANYVIKALGNVTGMTAAEKEGVYGFAQTVKAYLLFYVIRYTDVGGAALDALDSPTDAPPAIAAKPQVYARILGLLDSAQTHLNAAGATFSFSMTTGFSAFGTPTEFKKFNRALRAKVNLTNAQYATALADLGGSFLDATCTSNACLQTGAYNTYSSASGDLLNPYYDPTARQRYAHGSFAADAKLQAGAAIGDTTKRDLRFLNKIYALAPFARYGFNVAWAFKRYGSTVDPVPVMTNEELLLIRAEANIAGGTAVGASPVADINLVRTIAGNLPAIPALTWAALSPTQQRDTLLYEKRFSLMYQHGDRWVDLRRYGLLATLPKDRAGDLIFQNYKIPDAECVPRTTKPAGCTQLPGL